MVKNYLDLFEKPKQKSIRRKGLIYQNDNQIAGLSVRYHLGNGKREIRARFYPFNYFLQDLYLAHEIVSGDYDKYSKHYHFERRISEIEGHRENYYDDDGSIDSLRELNRDKEKFLRVFGEDTYNAMILANRMQAQEQLLSRFRLSIRDLYLLYMPLIMEQKFRRKLSPSTKNLNGIPIAISD